MVDVTQEGWSFDDTAIGKTRNGNRSLQTRQIVRPIGVSVRDWYDHAAIVCAALTTANAEAAELRTWRDAVDDELTSHMTTVDSFPEARAAVRWLIEREQHMALDPAISEDARKLVQAQAAAQEQRIAELERVLRIGDKVRVIGEYEADWRRIDAWIVGINMDDKGLNYTLGEQWPVRSRHSVGYLGLTDGFREGDLVRAALGEQQ